MWNIFAWLIHQIGWMKNIKCLNHCKKENWGYPQFFTLSSLLSEIQKGEYTPNT